MERMRHGDRHSLVVVGAVSNRDRVWIESRMKSAPTGQPQVCRFRCRCNMQTNSSPRRHEGHRGLVLFVASWCFTAVLLAGCATPAQKTAREQQRATAAKDLFDQTTRSFHLPAATAQGAARDPLLQQATAGYERLLRLYPDQSLWAAMALRSLGNIRATQNRLNDAVAMYTRVAVRYPGQDWEILQAWKSAADLLSEAGRPAEARAFYQKIVTRFAGSDQPAVVKVIVSASQRRLAEAPVRP